MLIIIAGYPNSGKSTLVKTTIEKIQPDINDHIIIIEPKAYMPDGYDEMEEDKKREYRIQSWNVSSQILMRKLRNPSDIIILDACCSNWNTMEPIIDQARINDHYVIYIFMATPVSLCKSRGDLPSSEIDRYSENFRISMMRLKNQSDAFVIIKDPSSLQDDASKLAGMVEKQYENGRIC